MENVNKCRVLWIDIVKGVAIILVVLGHIGLTNVSYIGPWVNSFHVPIFFFISGMLFSNSNSFGIFLNKKILELIKPYLYFSFIAILCLYLIKEFNWVEIKNILFCGWGGIALWFIPVLFFTHLVWFFVRKYIDKSLYVYLFVLLCLGGFLFSKYIGFVSYNLLLLPISVIYLGAGNWWKEKIIDMSKYSGSSKLFILMIVFLILSFLSILVNWKNSVSYASNQLGYILPSLLSGISGSFFICIFSILLVRFLSPQNCLLSILSYIGKNTYIILAFHQILLIGCTYMHNFITCYILYKSLELIIIVLGCFLLIHLINKFTPFMIKNR